MKQILKTDEPYCRPCHECRVIYMPFGGATAYCEADNRPVDGFCADRYREPGSDDDLMF